MTDNDNSENVTPQSVWTKTVTAVCPHCPREEQFAERQTAQAWLTGHIRAEHADELPAVDGTENDQ